MAAPNLVIVRNPFDRSDRDLKFIPIEDATVGYLVRLAGETEFTAAIDGEVITRDEWESRKIRQGEQLTLVPVLHGGGGDNQLLSTVAMIAIAVAAPYAAAAIMGTTVATLGFAGLALSVGIQIAGGMLVNSLLPPPSPKMPGIGTLESFDSSPTYSWNPKNTNEPGVAIARQYGKIRRKGNVIASYTDSTGDNGTTQTQHLLIDLGIGPIKSISDVLINGQPIASYNGVTVDTRLGLLDQTTITAFNDTRIDTPLSQKIVNGSPVTNVVGSGVDRIEAEVTFPQGLYFSNNSGGLDNYSVTLRFEIDDGGGYVQVGSDLIVTAATVKAVRRTFVATGLDKTKTYTIRITNLTADQTSNRYGDDVYLTTVRKVIFDDFEYPRTALLAVRAVATDQLSGGIDISCLAEGLYCNVWDGAAWNYEYTRNPAWVAWDVMTQPVWSNAGAVEEYEGIDPSQLNLDDFYGFAQHCDELLGGDVRFRIDGVFDTQTNVFDAANEILSTARACLVPQGTKFTVVWDRVRTTPAQLFSVGNTRVNGFREMFMPTAERIVRLEADFLNEETDHQRDTLTVINQGADVPGANVSSISMKWVTRPGQVWRECKYRLERNDKLKRTGEIDVDIDALACRVGDLVYLQSDVPMWGEGGRLVSATTTSVTLDKPVVIEALKSYQIVVRFTDDSIVFRNVTNAAGTHTTLNVSVAFSTAPAAYDVYSFGESNVAVKPFIVTSISRASDQTATLGLIEYNETIYNVDTDTPVLPTPNYTRESSVSITTPEITERLRIGYDGTVLVDLQVDFDSVDSGQKIISYTVQEIGPDGIWRSLITDVSKTIVLPNVQDGVTKTLRVQANGIVGVLLTSEQVEYFVIGKTAKPQNVTNFSIDGTTLNWTHVTDLDLLGYIVKFHYGSNQDWGSAVSLNEGVITESPFVLVQRPSGTVTLMIKAVDTTGNESEQAAVIVTDLGDADVANIVETIDFDALGYPGDITGGSIVAGDIEADATDSFYGTDDQSFYGLDNDSFYALTSYGQLQYVTDEFFVTQALVGSIATLQYDIEGTDLIIEYRNGGPGPFYEADSDSFYGPDADPFYTAGDWVLWPGQVSIKNDGYQFRVTVGAGATQGKIKDFALVIDAPDIEETIDDLVISATGTTIPYTKNFASINNIQATLQANLSGAETIRVDKSNPLSPVIFAYNSSSTAVSGATADIRLKGY